ncbi:MAG: cell division protein ZipA [Chromatiales bacterium]|nr:cell division protein ZipA [Chromatiales bacterium]
MILIVVGVAALVGIYIWDRLQKRRHAGEVEAADEEVYDDEFVDLPDEFPSQRRDPEMGQTELDLLDDLMEREQPLMAAAPPPAAAPQPAETAPAEERKARGKWSFRFGREPEPPPVAPDLRDVVEPKFMQISVVGNRGRRFNGADLYRAAAGVGLVYGEMNIFHRTSSVHGRPMFSMANLVEPGTFPPPGESDFQTPGLTFFLSLPGTEEGLDTFADMIESARRIANDLGGEMQDQSHSTLTRQTVEHMRTEILEHIRQTRLKMAQLGERAL